MMHDTDFENRSNDFNDRRNAIDQHINQCQCQYQLQCQYHIQSQPQRIKNNSKTFTKSLKHYLKNIRDEIAIHLINLDANVIFPLRVMCKRQEKKIRCVLCGSIVVIMLLLLMLIAFIFRENINDMID